VCVFVCVCVCDTRFKDMKDALVVSAKSFKCCVCVRVCVCVILASKT
jgi:hypothetical protein